MRMSSYLFGMVCLIAVSSAALADETAGRVFERNQGQVLVGRNPIANTSCAALVRDHQLYYNLYSDAFSSDPELRGPFAEGTRPDSISSGHFRKHPYRLRLDAGAGKMMDCYLLGRCFHGSLEVTYSSEGKIELIEKYENDKLVGSCEF